MENNKTNQAVPDWYLKNLEKIKEYLSDSELFIMQNYADLLMERVNRAKIKPENIEKKTYVFFQWLKKRKVFNEINEKVNGCGIVSDMPGIISPF